MSNAQDLEHEEMLTIEISDQKFDEWVRQYHRVLYGIAYWWTGNRNEAEELTQEAFFRAYRSRAKLRSVESAKSWLIGILKRCHLHMLREHYDSKEVSLDEVSYEAAEWNQVNPDILALRQALAKLEEHFRAPIVLFYFQGFSYREIAEALELPLGTVMSRLARARSLLHRHLDVSR